MIRHSSRIGGKCKLASSAARSHDPPNSDWRGTRERGGRTGPRLRTNAVPRGMAGRAPNLAMADASCGNPPAAVLPHDVPERRHAVAGSALGLGDLVDSKATWFLRNADHPSFNPAVILAHDSEALPKAVAGDRSMDRLLSEQREKARMHLAETGGAQSRHRWLRAGFQPMVDTTDRPSQPSAYDQKRALKAGGMRDERFLIRTRTATSLLAWQAHLRCQRGSTEMTLACRGNGLGGN